MRCIGVEPPCVDHQILPSVRAVDLPAIAVRRGHGRATQRVVVDGLARRRRQPWRSPSIHPAVNHPGIRGGPRVLRSRRCPSQRRRLLGRVGGHRIQPTGGHERVPTDGHSTAFSDRRADFRERPLPAPMGVAGRAASVSACAVSVVASGPLPASGEVSDAGGPQPASGLLSVPPEPSMPRSIVPSGLASTPAAESAKVAGSVSCNWVSASRNSWVLLNT
ncbi:unannotated protein [freshwater metagenome]|uniref:Unannotated protein n=1 Tax=freshwater metagenome TaxID=449393 RepID=A0A6J6X5Y5_9ZZZZ